MRRRYTRTAMLLHWLMALLIIGTFSLGLYMSDLVLSPRKLQLFAYHKWIGMALLGLWTLRVLWRTSHQPPALSTTLPLWQIRAANLTHLTLYVLLFTTPMTGWLMSSAYGFRVVMFGVWPLPNLIDINHALGGQLKSIHSLLNDGLLGLVGLHLLAVIQHQFILRDGLLWRMWPWGGKK
uniref:Putative cytochrome b561 n=1 Tax=mine drainage metagenome TaxID=410659 RepID=E6QUC7_9ZZZZ